MTRGALNAWLLALALLAAPVCSGAGAAPVPAGAAAMPGQAGGAEDEFFRRVRRAVTSEQTEALYALAVEDPWSFREVTHQLADLAMRQTGAAPGGSEGDGSGDEGLSRFLIAGHLAAIYMQMTEDITLAQRLKVMQAWSPSQVQARVAVDDLLAATGGTAPPSPRELEKSANTCRELGDLRCAGLVDGALGQTLERLGHADPAVLHYEKAAAAFRAGGELPRLRDALLARGQLLLDTARPGPAAESLGAAAAVSEQIGDAEGEIGSLILLAEAQVASGQTSRAFDVLSRARQIAFDAGLPVLAAQVILERARLRDADGARPTSAADYEAAGRLAEQGRALPLVAEAYLNAARIHAAAGATARGAEVIEKAVAAARLGGLSDQLGELLFLAGELHGDLDDWERAVTRYRDAAAHFARRGDDGAEARARQHLGAALLEAGRPEEARAPLMEAIRLARAGGLPQVEGLAEGGLGAAALARGDRAVAQAHYRRSAELLAAGGDAFQSLRMQRIAEELAERPQGSTP